MKMAHAVRMFLLVAVFALGAATGCSSAPADSGPQNDYVVFTDLIAQIGPRLAGIFEEAERTGEPFRPFEVGTDYLLQVDGKPRQDGVRDFLESRGIQLPEGSSDDAPDAETQWGLGNRKNELVQEVLASDGVEVFEGSVRLVEHLQRLGVRQAIVSSSDLRDEAQADLVEQPEHLLDVGGIGPAVHHDHRRPPRVSPPAPAPPGGAAKGQPAESDCDAAAASAGAASIAAGDTWDITLDDASTPATPSTPSSPATRPSANAPGRRSRGSASTKSPGPRTWASACASPWST